MYDTILNKWICRCDVVR